MELIRRCGFVFLLALAAPIARAADLGPPVYKSAPPEAVAVPLFSWTGFYLGINGGYSWGRTDWTGGAGDFTTSPSGYMLGGTAGYNLQTGAFVWGLEGDIDYADFNGTAANLACGTCTIKDTWLGTFRGRLGVAMNRWLPYVTGGGAWGNVHVSSSTGSVSTTKGGWTLGGGVEYSFAGPWSAKLEYLYVDLGNATCGSSLCALASDATVHFTSNIVRAGVNYRF